ncbi:SAM-dependent methyltransferase [Sporosarcina obsidiansis]|uniref:SAM-dependent methyltransferase n=1 Tax=Sporosarcina obsidiansis TaxID=2660748 RepID=UPI00129A54FB|nr:SAM-dependent methyltransferase [Sporosarcina obsidiansis]
MEEREIDKRLHVQTIGIREWNHQSSHYNRYEATPYEALDFLFSRHKIQTSGGWIDFGCGKGRVPFYVHYLYSLDVTGIEMNYVLHQDAMNNLMDYRQAFPKKRGTLSFKCCLAERYEIPSDATTFYFFNPFSLDIFRSVIHNIIRSIELAARPVEIILYYPTADYEQFLQDHSLFEKIVEIPIPHLYVYDEQERFLVYTYKKP